MSHALQHKQTGRIRRISFLLLSGILQFCNSSAQTTKTYTAVSNDKLCSYSLYLYNNGSFSMGADCPPLFHVTFGKWSVKKDTIRLNAFDIGNHKPIRLIEVSPAKTDTISVAILDSNGINITSRISIGLVTPNGTYFLEMDSTGSKKIVHARKNGRISLKTLNRVFNQRFEFDGQDGKDFIIRLNIPGEWIYNQREDWSGLKSLYLLKKNDRLITLPSAQLPGGLTFQNQ